MTLSIKNLAIYNSNNDALFSELSFSIKPGEILSLMGPSGCGKSTLLSIIAGHQPNDFNYSGDIYLNEKLLNDIAPEKRTIGILFQDDLLFPHLNIWQNLAIALPDSLKKQQRKEQAFNTLEELHLTFLAYNSPAQISGGQRARVSMMRMLLAEPTALLLDEPFNKLDKSLRKEFRDWVFTQIKSRKLPALLVTHDQTDIPDGERCLLWPENKEPEDA